MVVGGIQGICVRFFPVIVNRKSTNLRKFTPPDIVVAHFSTGCSLHSSYMYNESNALLSAQSCSNMLFQTSKIRKLPTSILSQGRRNAGNRKVINDLKSRHTHPTMARTGHRIPLRTENNCRHCYHHYHRHRRTAGWAASPNSRKR